MRAATESRPGLAVWLAVPVLLTLLMLFCLPAAGQTLDQVDDLMREGRMEAAREALLEWEAGAARPDREARQRALWFRAVLTVDPVQAEPSLRRLTLEYPGGTFTDRALYRLGLAAALKDDPATAARHLRVLVRDYPGSPVRTRAREWLRENGADVQVAAGVGTADRGRDGGAPPRRDAAAEGRDDAPPARPGGDFAAQVGAFGSLENAEAVAAELEEAGFEPRVVTIGGGWAASRPPTRPGSWSSG